MIMMLPKLYLNRISFMYAAFYVNKTMTLVGHLATKLEPLPRGCASIDLYTPPQTYTLVSTILNNLLISQTLH